MYKKIFIDAIFNKKLIELSFFSKEDGCVITRKCAPMDFGQSRRFKDNIERYHVWDYFPDGGRKPHPILIEPENVKSMKILDQLFDPKDFVTWNLNINPWHVRRDWGQYS